MNARKGQYAYSFIPPCVPHPSFHFIIPPTETNILAFAKKDNPKVMINLTAFHRAGRDLATTSPLWATRGKLWTGPPGLSRERWDFWKGRFEEAAESEDNIAEETKRTAATAGRAMAHVEALEHL